MSQLIRNLVLFISQICCVPKWLRLNCEGSATSSRWFRDTRDDFATILRGILSHKIFEHVQNYCDYFAPLGDTCEEITNHWRLFRDCFATQSLCLSPVVAKQSQSSEIGALSWPMWHTKMHFSAKCNSGRIAIQWFHIKHYLDCQYTKFRPYTFRVQKNVCFCTIGDFGSPTRSI